MSTNKKEAARKKSLGELGELFAIKTLVDAEYDKIRNVNDNKMNYAFADILCEKNGIKYAISVKARNKHTLKGSINTRYNLGSKAYRHAEKVAKELDAIPCWMAIQFDTNTYSVYFGTLEELCESKAIPIDKCEKNLIGETLVQNKRHYFDFDFYSNKKQQFAVRDIP